MLTSKSDVCFFDGYKKLVVKFQIKELDANVLRTVLGNNTKIDFNIDMDKLQLVDKYDKYRIALLYNVPMIDARIGWLLQKMCVTSEDLGFIITPFTRWHRQRIIECYYAVKSNMYKAYLELDKDKGLVVLTIDYNDFKL